MDWGDGTYELTAAALAPVSELVVEVAGVTAGQRILDVACGTGNAALAAAARGARVTGLDAAPRLVSVAAERAQAAGVHADWVVGDAMALPFEDDAFDAAVSVFGVIFAPDAARAAAELERVVRPGGVIIVTSWVGRGPLAEVLRATRRAIQAARDDQPPEADPIDWGEADTVAGLFGSSSLTAQEHGLEFRAASPAAWVQEQLEHHPAWRSTAARLPTDRMSALTDEITTILTAASTDPGEMRVTSPYLVLRAERGENPEATPAG